MKRRLRRLQGRWCRWRGHPRETELCIYYRDADGNAYEVRRDSCALYGRRFAHWRQPRPRR